MNELRNQFLYNRTLNQTAHWPVSTFIGLGRICVHLASLVKNAFGLLGNSQNRFYYATQAYIDLRGLVRGLIELPPIIGGIGSWYIDHFHLTPAQKLAYRVQEIYQTRLNKDDKWIEQEKDLVDVDPTQPPYNDPDFLDFINHQKVKVSTDETMIDTFCDAFFNCDLEHSVFNDRKLPFYALAAFARKKIDREDMATILQIYAAKQCFEDCKLATISDQSGALSENGTRLINALTEQRYNWLSLGKVDANLLKNELQKLPRHKQIFWKHEALMTALKLGEIRQKNPLFYSEMFYSPIGYLNSAGADIGAVWYDQDQELGLPFSVERVFLNTKYNKKNNPFQAKLGQFSAQDITKDVEEHQRRLCATFFPGTKQQVHVHNSLELPTTVISHDKTHAHILQQYSQEFLDFMADLRKDFRTLTGYKISKETWELVEMVAPSYVSSEGKLFALLLNFTSNTAGRVDEFQIKELFWNLNDEKKPEPTPLLWLLLLKLRQLKLQPDTFDHILKIQLNDIYPCKHERDLIKSVVMHGIIEDTDTMKQKIWKLQTLFRGKPPTSVSDEHLKFSKVAKGARKNTVILKAEEKYQVPFVPNPKPQLQPVPPPELGALSNPINMEEKYQLRFAPIPKPPPQPDQWPYKGGMTKDEADLLTKLSKIYKIDLHKHFDYDSRPQAFKGWDNPLVDKYTL